MGKRETAEMHEMNVFFADDLSCGVSIPSRIVTEEGVIGPSLSHIHSIDSLFIVVHCDYCIIIVSPHLSLIPSYLLR